MAAGLVRPRPSRAAGRLVTRLTAWEAVARLVTAPVPEGEKVTVAGRALAEGQAGAVQPRTGLAAQAGLTAKASKKEGVTGPVEG